ncbi:hypothetical protein ACQKM9_10510 [Viridibacillus sp. NPDC093762]
MLSRKLFAAFLTSIIAALLVSFVYATIFFIIDSLSRYFEESKQI